MQTYTLLKNKLVVNCFTTVQLGNVRSMWTRAYYFILLARKKKIPQPNTPTGSHFFLLRKFMKYSTQKIT